VRSEALDSNGRVLGVSGTRRFWKSAPYEPGAYSPKPYSYAECIKRYCMTLFSHTNTQHFLKFGRPDGYTDLLNIYPAKMNSALIRGMIRFAQIDPSHRDNAMKVARNAADYMLSISQPADAPLAYFPPTYFKMEGQKSNFASVKYAGQNMLTYPATMAMAYLDLHDVDGDGKYLNAAVNIAKTYEKLQMENGTWYLKMWEKDASPVIEGNGNIPVKIAFSSSGLPGSYLAPAPSGATPTVMNQAYERFIKHLDLLLVLECLDESGRLVDHWGNVIYYSNPGKLNPSGFDMVSAGSDLAFGSSRQAVPPENRQDYEVDGKLVCDDVVFL
jgi:hypothetical protein